MHPHLSLLISIFSLLPSVVLARGGRGHGGGGGGGIFGDSISSLSFEPIVAAIFAFCVIFAVFTTLQAIQALINIRRRITRQPPSITLPEFSVGPIFPAFLLLSTMCLTAAYVLHGAFWGIMYNQNRHDDPTVSDGFIIAWVIMGFFADIFLISAILALITHREKVLLNTSRVLRDAKMVGDAILVVILLALSISYTGLAVNPSSAADAQTADHLYIAYISFLLIATVDIAVSSILLYVRSRHAPINDHKVALCLAFIISPLFIIYALYFVVVEGLGNIGNVEATIAQWDLENLVVDCITEFIIIATCLTFGMPFIPKQKGRK